VIEVCESEFYGVRMEGSLAVARMFQYSCGDMWIGEDVEEAAETADGVFRLRMEAVRAASGALEKVAAARGF